MSQVDILQISVLEFVDRPGRPLFHLEHYVDGEYIKYNSNSGFVEENLRLTPQVRDCWISQQHILYRVMLTWLVLMFEAPTVQFETRLGFV